MEIKLVLAIATCLCMSGKNHFICHFLFSVADNKCHTHFVYNDTNSRIRKIIARKLGDENPFVESYLFNTVDNGFSKRVFCAQILIGLEILRKQLFYA